MLCGALVLSSCMHSNEEINPLTGTWTLKGISCQNCVDKTQISSTTFSCSESACNTYTFNQDGSVTLVESADGSVKTTFGNYSITGLKVTLHLNGESSTVKTYSFTFSGSMLYLKEIVDENAGQCSSTTVLSK